MSATLVSVASPMQGLLTDIVALGTSQLVGRTAELSRPEGAVVARIERVALVPSDPAPARMLDPVASWLDTIEMASAGMARDSVGVARDRHLPSFAGHGAEHDRDRDRDRQEDTKAVLSRSSGRSG